MSGDSSFESLVIVVVLAFLMPILLNRFRLNFIPVVVAEIVAGIVVGITGFDIVGQGPILSTLSTLGFVYLLFLSGLEIDFSVFSTQKKGHSKKTRKDPNGFILSIVIFALILTISFLLSLIIMWMGFAKNPYLMTLVISTISLGIVVPTLKDSGIVKTGVGQNILLITVVGDLMTMILLAVFVSLRSSSSGSTWLILILFAVGLVLYFVGKYFKHLSFLDTMSRGTVQIDTRAIFALIIVLVSLAQTLGTEIILGSFLAGVLVSLLSPNPSMVQKLDSFGYGFLIPIFFVMVGVQLDLRSIFTDLHVLALLPLLFVAFFLAKLIPVLILKKWYNWRTVISIGLLISAKLTLVIAAARIGQKMHIIDDTMASAIIFVGVISCILGPILFKKLFPFVDAEARKKIVFIGANNITLPLSLELDSERYDIIVYHKETETSIGGIGSDFKVEKLESFSQEALADTSAFTADILIITTGSDEINAQLARIAKKENIERIICRLETPDLVEALRDEGVEVFSSIFSTKAILKAMIQSPGIVDLLTTEESGLSQVTMENPKYNGVPLRRFPFLGDTIIVRIFRGGESIIPHGDTELKIGDRLLLTGGKDHINTLMERLGTAT